MTNVEARQTDHKRKTFNLLCQCILDIIKNTKEEESIEASYLIINISTFKPLSI